MTVYSERNKIAYIGNPAQRLYPIPFEYINVDNIAVSIYTDDNQFVESWTYSSQFVVEGDNIRLLDGYSVEANQKILIIRTVDIVQDNRYREGGDFPAKSTETSFDKLTMIAQQLEETLERCVKVEVLDNQTPEELLEEVYRKLDSATEIAEDAIEAANQAQIAADNATQAVETATQTLIETQAYVDSAKIEIKDTKDTAIEEVNTKVTDAKADINSTVVTAQTDIISTKDTAIDAVEAAVADLGQTVINAKADIEDTKTTAETTITNTVNQGKAEIQGYVDSAEDEVRQIARTEAQEAIADAEQDVQDYADTTIKPSLQTYVDSAAASEQVATQSADNAVESATQALASATNAQNSATTAEEWARYAEGKGNPNWGYIGGDIENQADLMMKFDAVDDKIKEIELFKFPNADIIGEPIIQSGQVSGFSTVSYLQFPFIFDLRDQAFQIDFSFTTATNVQTQQNILDSKFGIALAIANGKGLMAISSNGTSWNVGQAVGNINIQSNTTYYARLIWNKLQYKTLLSTDGVNYTEDMVLTGAVRPYPRTIFIGGCDLLETGHDPHPFLGTINLNRAYLYVNNNLIWQGMDDAGLATRADVSLSNLDSEGQAKFDAKLDKSTITNCITEIPQDIKLELNNGTLTLKAGSKVYVPRTNKEFLEVTISKDLTYTYSAASAKSKLFYNLLKNSIFGETNTGSGSGINPPQAYYTYYDVDLNVVRRSIDGSNWSDDELSLPLCDMTSTQGTGITSIDQVFNGFGYIGSTVFALPGVKGLIPNGRNADGSLKNVEVTVDSVKTATNPDTNDNLQYIDIGSDGSFNRNNFYLEQKAQPNFISNNNNLWYNPETNMMYYYRTDSTQGFVERMFSGVLFKGSNTTSISYFNNTKTAFHAVDYNDAALKEQFQVVTALPANPTPGVFYFIVE